VTEGGSDGDEDGRAAVDRLHRSDIDLADASPVPKAAETKAVETSVPAADPPEADEVTAKDLAPILALTSVQPSGAKASDVPDRPSEASQGAGPSVSPKAAIEAGPGPKTPVAAQAAQQAAQMAPAPKGQLDQKVAVHSREPAAHATFTSSADVPKSIMPGLVVTPPAKIDLPKANVVRQEAHFAPVVPSTPLSRPGVAAVAGAKPGAGSEAKGNEAASLPIDPAVVSAEEPATAPVPQPAQQIANRISTEVAAFEVVDRFVTEPNQVATKPVLKVLQIQLQPAELGTVTIRMELREAGLELHVEAARAETAEIIRGDKDALSNLLRSSGYNVDVSSIRVVEGGDRTGASPQSGQQGAQANLQSSTQSHHGGSGEERAQRGKAGSNDGDGPKQTNRTDNHETTTSRTGGGVYV
jgi:chemotaxis protein MotD